MFFVFESGNPQDGEAAGGLGDMHRAFDELGEATEFSESAFYSTENVEILDGSNGDVIRTLYGEDGWHRSPRDDFNTHNQEPTNDKP